MSLDKADHRSLVLWATDCAEHVTGSHVTGHVTDSGGFRGHNTYFARYSSAPVVSSPVSAPSSEDATSVEQKAQLFILGLSSSRWLVLRWESRATLSRIRVKLGEVSELSEPQKVLPQSVALETLSSRPGTSG